MSDPKHPGQETAHWSAPQAVDAVAGKAPLSVQEFLQRLTDSRLMTIAEIEACRRAIPKDQQSEDSQAMARSLVQDGRLTLYQVERIASGQTRYLVLNDYEVRDYLGGGGMGQVLKARHRRMHRDVAVKIIAEKALDDADALRRFHQEVQAAAQLSHPNIVTAYDAGEQDGLHYLVMEYVNGRDLDSILRQRGCLPVDEALDYILQAAMGLRYAHSKGVIHRDIKPSNLLADADGTLKILDMGIATLGRRADASEPTQAHERLTRSGQVMGTVEYMSPEQARDIRDADARSDVYSLGCTLFRLLIGRPAFSGETMMAVLIAHREDPIPSLRAERAEIAEQLERVVQKMIAKRPVDRQQNMDEVIESLQRCRGGPAPSRARPAPPKRSAQAASDIIAPHPRVPGNESGSGQRVAPGTAVSAPRALSGTTMTQTRPATPAVSGGVGQETLRGRAEMETDATLGTHLPRRNWRARKALFVVGTIVAAMLVGFGVLYGLFADRRGAATRTDTAASVGPTEKAISPAKTNLPPSLAKAPFGPPEAAAHQAAWAKYLHAPVEVQNSIGMKLRLIPPGEYLRGSSLSREELTKKFNSTLYNPTDMESPLHTVILTKAFYIGIHEVTQGQWKAIMHRSIRDQGELSGKPYEVFGEGDSYPIYMVSWPDAVEFCTRLSAAEGKKYRLPTDAEWEYACRAGTDGFFSGTGVLDDMAWFGDNSGNKPIDSVKLWNDNRTQLNVYFEQIAQNGGKTHVVGTKRANGWGLFDMHGNVAEWCQDFAAPRHPTGPVTDPTGPGASKERVVRGGAFTYRPIVCRSASRGSVDPDQRGSQGFRVVQVIDTSEPTK